MRWRCDAMLMTLMLLLSAQRDAAEAIDRLSWMSGCWTLEGAEHGSLEVWLPPAGNTLLGMSRTVKGGKTIAHEFMQIREGSTGEVVFVAKPSGQEEASFTLLRATAREVIFENKAHDFPQRVAYRLDEKGELIGRIEGTRNGKERVIEYPMRKTSCTPNESKQE